MYDFDRIVDRKSTNDLKWHSSAVSGYLGFPVPEKMIPMWLADTEFACFPGIVEGLKNRTEKEIFGYCAPMKDFYSAIKYWQKSRFDWDVDESWIGYIPTVVAGINIAIRAFSNEGDGVIIQQPVYDPFASIVKKTNRKVVNNGIICENGSYKMNFEQLEELASKEENKIMVICSPHNPIGRVWTKEELHKVADICLKHNVLLISDEIHCDIVFDNNKHYPLLNLDEKYQNNFISLYSPGKTFNVAGLKVGFSVIPNKDIRDAFNAMQVAMSLDIKNTFGVEVVSCAYTKDGEQWLGECLDYMQQNIDFVQQYIKENMPNVSMIRPQATFLCWIDLSALGFDDKELSRRIIFDANVICVPGTWFGPGGEQHLRLNIGCPRSILKEALDRITKALYA